MLGHVHRETLQMIGVDLYMLVSVIQISVMMMKILHFLVLKVHKDKFQGIGFNFEFT